MSNLENFPESPELETEFHSAENQETINTNNKAIKYGDVRILEKNNPN